MARTTFSAQDVLRRRVREFRKLRGWTQGQLAEEVTSLGLPMHHSTISKIERIETAKEKARDVTIDEVLFLAAALNVPPPMLLLPIGSSEWLRITNKSVVRPLHALDWLAGDCPLDATDKFGLPRPIRPDEWRETAGPFHAARRWHDAKNAAWEAFTTLKQTEYSGTDAQIKKVGKRFIDALKVVLRAQREVGLAFNGRPPDLPAKWQELVRQFALDKEVI